MAYGDFDIAVGEEVGVVRRNRNWGGILFSKFGTVTKINGHGHIYVQCGDQEYRFTRRGYAYKDDYGPGLMQAAQLRAELAREEERKTRARLAREMEQTLKDGWSYSGTFHVSQERVAQMKALVAEMEKLIVEA
jgi:hypothetical protein